MQRANPLEDSLSLDPKYGLSSTRSLWMDLKSHCIQHELSGGSLSSQEDNVLLRRKENNEDSVIFPPFQTGRDRALRFVMFKTI